MNNNTIKCVAIDDEPLALEVIRKFCERIGGIDVQTFSDPAAGLDVIKREKPSIAFLDIEMENISGLTIASQLPPEVDYLHKPFAFSRFQTAFAKAVRRIEGASRPREDNRSLMVKQEYNTVNVPLRSILYIEAMEGYVKIFREDGICTVSRIILKNVGSQLPEEDFLRIHRSFIVSKSKIKSFNRQSVTLSSGVTLPIGRQYVNDMMRMLNC